MADVSLRDIFVPLSIGGTLYIPDETVKNSPPELYQWLKKNKISLCHIVPTLFRILCAYISDSVRDKEILQHLRFILLAGEALYGQDVNTWRTLAGSSAKLVNVYGPSETTLAKLFYPIEDTYYEPNEIIPLGKPLPDTHIVIIRDEKPVAQGDTGEICIKTPYRSKGYVGDPELTKAAFIPDVYSAAPGVLSILKFNFLPKASIFLFSDKTVPHICFTSRLFAIFRQRLNKAAPIPFPCHGSPTRTANSAFSRLIS